MNEWDRPGPSGIKIPSCIVHGKDKGKKTSIRKKKKHISCEHIVFINDLDLYNGRYLCRFYGNQTFGKLAAGICLKKDGNELYDSANESSFPREEPMSQTNISSQSYLGMRDNGVLDKCTSHSSSPSKSGGSSLHKHGLNDSQLDRATNNIGKLYDSEGPSCSDTSELKLQSQSSSAPENSQDDSSLRLVEDSSSHDVEFEDEKYYVVGTTYYPESEPAGMCEIVGKAVQDSVTFEDAIRKSNTVIYDVTENNAEVFEARMALQIMLDQCEEHIQLFLGDEGDYMPIRRFVLITPVATWRTFDIPEGQKITELNYFDRTTCSEKYVDQVEFEYEVLEAGLKYPELLKTFVICCGIPYGYEQNMLSTYFKFAWGQSEFLPVFKDGDSKLPLIHIDDLSRIVYTVALEETSSGVYVLAMEPALFSFFENIDALREVALIPEVKIFENQEKFLEIIPMKDGLLDVLTVQWDFKPLYIKNKIQMRWRGNGPFICNVANVLGEYIHTLNISALRIVILGPPSIGKTRVAMMLHEMYRVQYLSVAYVIDTFTQRLTYLINQARSIVELTGRKDLSEPLPFISLQTFVLECFPVIEKRVKTGKVTERDLIILENGRTRLAEEQMENSNRLKDESVGLLYQMYLNRPRTLKEGYVMDGYPKTPHQAACIFPEHGLDSSLPEDTTFLGEELRKPPATRIPLYNKFPNLVVILEAKEDMILIKSTQSPGGCDKGSSHTLQQMEKRLQAYKNRTKCAFNLEIYFQINEVLILKRIVDYKCTNRHIAIFEEISEVVGRQIVLNSEKEIDMFADAYFGQDEEWVRPKNKLQIGKEKKNEVESQTKNENDNSDEFNVATQSFNDDLSLLLMSDIMSDEGPDIDEEFRLNFDNVGSFPDFDSELFQENDDNIVTKQSDECYPKSSSPPAALSDTEDSFLTATTNFDRMSFNDSPYYYTPIYNPDQSDDKQLEGEHVFVEDQTTPLPQDLLSLRALEEVAKTFWKSPKRGDGDASRPHDSNDSKMSLDEKKDGTNIQNMGDLLTDQSHPTELIHFEDKSRLDQNNQTPDKS